MKLSKTLFVILLFVIPFSASHSKQPDRAILEMFEGTWDTTITNRANGQSIKTVGKRKWSKAGTVLHFEEMDLSTNKEQHFLITYDPNAKVFRGTFINHVVVANYEGKWDNKTTTMHWTGTDSFGSKHVAFDRFLADGKVEWSMVITSAEGKVVLELDAKSNRRDKADKEKK